MPSNTTTELLAGILEEINEIKEMQKKMHKTSSPKEQATQQAMSSSFSTQAKASSALASLDAFKYMAQLVKRIKGISIKDAQHVADVMNILSGSIKTLQLSKDDISNIKQTLHTLEMINSVFGSMADSFFKNMWRFMPIKGTLLGHQIGKFYKNLLAAFEKEKLGDVINAMSNNLGNKNNSANISAFGSMLTQLFAIDMKNLLALTRAFKAIPKSAGADIKNFIKPITEIFKNDNLKQNDVKQTSDSIRLIFGLFSSFTSKDILNLIVMSQLLTEKRGSSMGKFFTGLFGEIKSVSPSSRQMEALYNLINMIISFGVTNSASLLYSSKLLTQSRGNSIGSFFSSLMTQIQEAKNPSKTQLASIQELMDMLLNIGYFNRKALESLYETMIPENGIRLGSFFSSLMSSIQETKNPSKTQLSSIQELMDMLLNIGYFNRKALESLYETMIPENGAMLGSFFSSLMSQIQTIKVSKGLIETISFIESFIKQISISSILTLKAMSGLLGPEEGKRIGQFYTELLKNLTSVKESKTEQAMKFIKALNQVVTTLTLCLVAIVAVSALVDVKDIAAGMFMFASTILGVKVLMDFLGDKKNMKMADKSLQGIKGIMLLMGGLTLVLGIVTLISYSVDIKDIIGGFAITSIMLLMTMGIINWLSNKEFKKKQNISMTSLAGIALLIMGLTLTLGLILEINKRYDAKDIGLGMLTLGGIILFAVGIMWILSTDKLKKMSKTSIKSTASIVLLIMGLTLSLGLVLVVTEKYDWKQIGKGMLVLGGLVLFAVGIMWILSTDKVKRSANQSIKTLLVVTGVLLVATLFSIMFAKLGENWDATLKGTIAASAVMLAGIGLVYIANQISAKDALKGALTLAVVSLVVLGISEVMKHYADMCESFVNLSGKDIAIASGITLAVITAVGAAMLGVGALVAGPQAILFMAGFGALELVTVAILSISSAMTSFADMIDTVNKKLTETSVASAKGIICGKNGMVECIIDMVDSLDGISGWSALKIAGISKCLYPLFETLGGFIDVISKMANMQIVEGYDNNGNPIYRAMKAEEFKSASNALTTGFTTFISELIKAFTGDSKGDEEKAKSNSSTLIGKASRIINMLGKTGFRNLIVTLGYFVDTIQKMASMQIAEKWDENGKPISFRKMTEDEFILSAQTLSTAFTTFLLKLQTDFVGPKNVSKIADIIEELTEAGVPDLMKALSSFAYTIQNLASMQVADKWDENGKPVHFTKLEDDDFIKAANTVSIAFSSFLSTLAKYVNEDMADDLHDIIKDLTSGGILDLMTAIGEFVNPIMQLATGKFHVGDKDYDVDQSKCLEAATSIVQIFRTILTPMKELYSLVEGLETDSIKEALDMVFSVFKDVMKLNPLESNLAQNALEYQTAFLNIFDLMVKTSQLSTLMNAEEFKNKTQFLVDAMTSMTTVLKDTPKIFADASDAFSKLDNALFDKHDKRMKVLDETQKMFDGIAKSVDKLTESIHKLSEEQQKLTQIQLSARVEQGYAKTQQVIEQTAATQPSVGISNNNIVSQAKNNGTVSLDSNSIKALANLLFEAINSDTRPRNYEVGAMKLTAKGGQIFDVVLKK